MAGTTKKTKETVEPVKEQVAEQTVEQAVEPVAEQTEEKPKRYVEVRLPRLEGRNAVQEEFYSVNFNNYIIKRGVYVKVPEEVAEVIRNQEKDGDYAMRYVEEHALREAK